MILSLKSWWSAEGHRNPLFLRMVEELIFNCGKLSHRGWIFFVLFFNFFPHPLFRDRNEQQIKACCTCKLFSSRSLLLGFSPAGMFKSFKYVSAVFFKFYKNHSWNRGSSIMKMLFMYFNDVILIHLMPLWDLKNFFLPFLAGDLDITVFSKYISDMKRVFPAVEGRITFRNSAVIASYSIGLLLLSLCLSVTLWLPFYTLVNCDKLKSSRTWLTVFSARCPQS